MAPTQPERLTAGTANDQLLYFTSNSLTADDQTIVFLSDRDSAVQGDDPRANVNLYALDRTNGEVRRLTDHREGNHRTLRDSSRSGINMGSPCLHAESGDVYYVHGRELRCVNAFAGEPRTLGLLPSDHVTFIAHVSDDNSRVCVPTIHESAISDPSRIDATVQELGLVGHLRVFDTGSGDEVEDVEVERGWVTHVQFRPGHPNTILFNHEWPSDCGIRRMWLWDGQRMRRLRDEDTDGDDPPRHRTDWVCHEVWNRDGGAVIYHGGYARETDSPFAGRFYLGRVDPDSGDRAEIAFPPEFRRYGHFSVGATDTQLVGDGYAEYGPDGELLADANRRGSGEWISRLDVDWDRRTIDWTALCRHGTSWTSQDAHPHPIVDHAGATAFYTSDQPGNRAFYAVSFEGAAG